GAWSTSCSTTPWSGARPSPPGPTATCTWPPCGSWTAPTPSPARPMSADPSTHPRLRLATRGSALALVQSRIVADGLRAAWPELGVELVTVVTEGDKRRDVPAAALGGKGIFTAAGQQAVLDGRADLAVHSAKDLPAAQVPGLVLAAVPPRGDPPDALVGRPPASGTGAPRRVALLNWLRPDLELVPIRGNVDSRVRRVHAGELDAVVLAVAGLRRLGLGGEGAVPLDPEAFPPAPGQGTLAVEAREDDTPALGLLSALTPPPSRVALRAECAFLRRLGGSCTLPAGAYLRPTDAGPLEIHGFLSALDGKGLC